MWKLVSLAAGAGSAVAVRKIIAALWPSSRPDPPLNPADRRITWSDGLQWAIASGIGAGVARLVGQRVAAAGWETATGHAPPGVETPPAST